MQRKRTFNYRTVGWRHWNRADVVWYKPECMHALIAFALPLQQDPPSDNRKAQWSLQAAVRQKTWRTLCLNVYKAPFKAMLHYSFRFPSCKNPSDMSEANRSVYQGCKAPYTLSDKHPICLTDFLSEANLKHFRFPSDPVWNICFSQCLFIKQWKAFARRRRMERKGRGRQKER